MAGRSEGRVALVTGGARGIGAATAERLAEDGAAIALCDLDLDAAEATASSIAARCGVKAIGLKANVAVTEEVERMVEEIALRLGSLDILVNNAGITRDNLIHKMSDEDWDAVAGVHLRVAFAARARRSARWSSVIGGGSLTCRQSRRWAIVARRIIRPPRPGCRAWQRRWQSNLAATASPPTRSRPALSTVR